MAHEVRRIPRYSSTFIKGYLGPDGEILQDTTTDELVLQNGTRGGVRFVKKSDFEDLVERVKALENK